MRDFRGLVNAIVTPFGDDGAILEPELRAIVDYQFEAGLHGLFVCGSGGEGILMNVEERQRVAEIVLDQTAGRGKVIVHVGALATHDCVALARHAEEQGADAISAIPSFYFGRDDDSIVAYYRAMSEAVSVPLYAYHIPSLTNLNMTVELLERLIAEAGIAGLKYTDFDLLTVQQFLDCGGGCQVFYGRDEQIVAGLLMGCQAGIGSTYNMMPNLFARIWEQLQGGDIPGAIETQNQINAAIRALHGYPGIAAVKAALGFLGLNAGTVRGPNLDLTPEQKGAYRSDLEACGFFDLVPGPS